MKLSDYVAQKVCEFGITQVFMVTGGGAMHLNQSLGSHPDLNCTFNHHEQACAIAAESYYRLTNTPALVNVTTGPGGTNTLTGVHGAWTDSLGILVISGQVKYQTTIQSTGLDLRQMGDQEIDIIKVVSSITKYSVIITDPTTIRYHLEKAFYLAQSGRPGPCWIDIPLDVQAANIDPETLDGFDPAELDEPWKHTDLDRASQDILQKIMEAERPVIFVGAGVRISGHHGTFLKLVDTLNIPVVTGWNAHDALWDGHPCFAGRPGSVGTRGGNFVVQNADFLLILGSRLNIRQVSYNWECFARKAYKVWVDIDKTEMEKPTVPSQMKIHADLGDLLPILAEKSAAFEIPDFSDWLEWCKERNANYPAVLEEYWSNDQINPYCFTEQLFEQLDDDQITVCANGSASVISFQTAKIKRNQRLWTNSGCASMGYDLPAAIGAHKGCGRSVVCIAGDGSIMMNLQEIQTIVGQNMPIKIFLINNKGYSSIFQTHRNFFDGHEVGASEKSGVSFPDFSKLSVAFGLPYQSCHTYDEMEKAIQQTLLSDGPVFCEVFVDANQTFAPKLSSKQLPDGTIVSPSLEDMSPFLPEDELKKNMLQ